MQHTAYSAAVALCCHALALAVWLFGSFGFLLLCSLLPAPPGSAFLLEAQIRRWRLQRKLSSARALHRAPRPRRAAQSAASEHCCQQSTAEHCTAVVVSWRAARDGSLHTIGAPAEVQYRMSLLSKELLAKSLRAEEAGAGAGAGGPALQVKLYCTYLRMSLHASLHTSDLSPPSSPSLAFPRLPRLPSFRLQQTSCY